MYSLKKTLLIGVIFATPIRTLLYLSRMYHVEVDRIERDQLVKDSIEIENSIISVKREIARGDSILAKLQAENEKLRQMNAKVDEMIKRMGQ